MFWCVVSLFIFTRYLSFDMPYRLVKIRHNSRVCLWSRMCWSMTSSEHFTILFYPSTVIGHFRNLFLKASLGNILSYEWLCTSSRFDRGA